MAERHPVHQQSGEGGGMVPYNRTVRLPLLPYERQLIEMLGISREEYEQFVAEIKANSKPIPADAIVADAGLTVAIISLVIGLASTAVSFFLTPKPRAVDTRRRDGGTISLAGVTGQDRFAPSFGFESQQDLAAYGAAIPLIFTKKSSLAGDGLLVSPQLVWSRVLSRGAYQIVELQYLVGQGPLPLRSDWPSGAFGNLFLGNNTIDPGAVDDYAFYYRDGSGTDNRFGREHLLNGNLMAEVEPFRAPSKAGAASLAFCSSFTPSNNTSFGVYSPIPNGTSLRLNWQVIAVNDQPGVRDEDKDFAPLDIRKWISGTFPTRSEMIWQAMPGTGANYSRRTGIWNTNATTVESTITTFGDFKAKIYEGDIGTELLVVVGVGRQALELDIRYESESSQGQELRNTLENEHSAQDAALQVGEQFIIGTGLWQVIRRQQLEGAAAYGTDGYWHLEPAASGVDADAKSIPLLATLRCIRKIGGFSKEGGLQPVVFGVPNQRIIEGADETYLGISNDDGTSKGINGKDLILDEAFFPICKANVAVVQNTRPCEVTEIGIRSQVWLRYNNLCNFITVPAPEVLRRAQERGSQYQTGNINSYAKRVSLFSLDVRYAGSTSEDDWAPVGRTFAVVGDTPTDQYNYIRITNPTGRALEYRMRPRTSADAVYINGPDWDVVVLDASRNEEYPWTHPALGTTLSFLVNGRITKISSLWSNKETSAIATYRESIKTTQPTAITLEKYQYRFGTGAPGTPDIPEVSRAWQFMIAYRNFFGADIITNPPLNTDTAPGSTYFANADPNRYKAGEVVSVVEGYRPSGSDRIIIRFDLVATRVGAGPFATGSLYWTLKSATVVEAGTGHAVGSNFFKGLILGYQGGTSTFKNPVLEAVFRVVGVRETVTEETITTNRVFERYSALAEVSRYGSLIQRSCDSSPEHEIVYINESLEDSPPAQYPRCAMAGLRLRAGAQFRALDQFRMFVTDGLKVPTLPETGASTLSSSNLFTELANYLITNTETGAGNVAAGLVDEDQMRATTRFLQANNLFFNDVITDPVNIRTYLGEIAPSMLCALVIRNGRFSIEPALPTTPTGAISPNKVPITAMFTSGNILEDSFSVEYLPAEERKDFTAIIRWRQYTENQLPQTRAYEAYYTDTPESKRPIEEFDLRWVTSESHAIRAARYFLAIRRHVTHTVKFKTTPLGSALIPGSYIIVSTEANPYTPLNNGIVLPDGKIISASPLETGTYPIYYWQRGKTAVDEDTMVVVEDESDGLVKVFAPRDVLFAVRNTEPRQNCYMVEAITLDEDGMVDVVASHFPLDSSGRSVIAREILGSDGSPFTGTSL